MNLPHVLKQLLDANHRHLEQWMVNGMTYLQNSAIADTGVHPCILLRKRTTNPAIRLPSKQWTYTGCLSSLIHTFRQLEWYAFKKIENYAVYSNLENIDYSLFCKFADCCFPSSYGSK